MIDKISYFFTVMNKVMLIGNLGKDPVVRYYDADQAVAQFTLATTERGYTLPNGTKVPDRTDWHNVVVWKNLAKVAERYLHKGDKVYVEGKIRYRSYDDRKGQRQYITEIYADSMELLTPKAASAGASVNSVASTSANMNGASAHSATGTPINSLGASANAAGVSLSGAQKANGNSTRTLQDDSDLPF